MSRWFQAALAFVVCLGLGALMAFAFMRGGSHHGPEARLAAAMAGLFSAGVAVVLALVVLFTRKS